MPRILLCLVLALTVASVSSAQVSPLVGTGCANAGATLVSGQPRLGQSITIVSDQFPCNSPQTFGFVLVGVACQVAPPLPWACNASFNPCSLLASIDASTFSPIRASVTLTVPNDPMLVGAGFCAQGGCYTMLLPPPGLTLCLTTLRQIVSITIQP